MAAQFVDTYIPTRLGDTSQDYYRWRGAVLAVRLLPEYKLKKLWKLNFSVRDIEANKHWEIYPPDKVNRRRKVLGRSTDDTRGRKISAKKKQWLYARALRDVAEGILQFNHMDGALREETLKERETFVELMKRFAHKPTKG